MRLIYYQEKLYLSLTRSEVEEVNQNKGKSVELPIGNLLPLHKDISDAIQNYIKDIHFYSSDENTK